jgi:hypothetical protein
MVRPHAFQGWIDGAIRHSIRRVHARRDEIGARLIPDMVRRSLAKGFVIAPLVRFPIFLLLEVASNAARNG